MKGGFKFESEFNLSLSCGNRVPESRAIETNDIEHRHWHP